MASWKCEICGTQVTRRGTKPGRFCSVECRSELARRQKPEMATKEWLYQKYIVEELTATDIAVMVKRNSKRVWEWLKNYGIPTRGRGGASTSGSFQKGNHSPTTGTHRPEDVKEKLRQARKVSPNLPHLMGQPHYLKGKRGSDTPNWKGGVTPERQAFYSSEEWKQAVVVVWQRDNAICRRCNSDYRVIRHENIQFAIHHIESFAVKEKRADPNNLVLLCRTCHLWVHSKANTEKEFIK